MIVVDRIACLFGFILWLIWLWSGVTGSFLDHNQLIVSEILLGLWLIAWVVLRFLDWITGGPARRRLKGSEWNLGDFPRDPSWPQ